MKSKAYEYAQMTREEREMTLFYTIEEMIKNLQEIQNDLNTESDSGFARLARIEDISNSIEAIAGRVYNDKKPLAIV